MTQEPSSTGRLAAMSTVATSRPPLSVTTSSTTAETPQMMTRESSSTSKIAARPTQGTTQTPVATSRPLQHPPHQHCRGEEVSYLPLDMTGVRPTRQKTSSQCQQFCAGIPGAAYYSFFELGLMCHCQSADVALRQENSLNFVGGETSCGGVKQHPETTQILKRIEAGCYEVGIFYSPVMLNETSHQFNSFQCQQHCEQVVGCAHFIFFVLDRSCQLVGSQATQLTMAGAVSGPQSCGGAATPPTKLFLAHSAVIPRSISAQLPFSPACLLGLGLLASATSAGLALAARCLHQGSLWWPLSREHSRSWSFAAE